MSGYLTSIKELVGEAMVGLEDNESKREKAQSKFEES
jgi:hypothetical protein